MVIFVTIFRYMLRDEKKDVDDWKSQLMCGVEGQSNELVTKQQFTVAHVMEEISNQKNINLWTRFERKE